MKDIPEIQALLKESQWVPSSKIVDDVCRKVRLELSKNLAPPQTSVLDWFKIVALPAALGCVALLVSFSQSAQVETTLPSFSKQTLESSYQCPVLAQTIADVDFSKKPTEVVF